MLEHMLATNRSLSTCCVYMGYIVFCRQFGVSGCDYWWCEWPDSASKSMFSFRLLLDAFQVHRGWEQLVPSTLTDLETSAAGTLPWLRWTRIYKRKLICKSELHCHWAHWCHKDKLGVCGVLSQWSSACHVYCSARPLSFTFPLLTMSRSRLDLLKPVLSRIQLQSGQDAIKIHWLETFVEWYLMHLEDNFLMLRLQDVIFDCRDWTLKSRAQVHGRLGRGKVDIAWNVVVRTTWPCWKVVHCRPSTLGPLGYPHLWKLAYMLHVVCVRTSIRSNQPLPLALNLHWGLDWSQRKAAWLSTIRPRAAQRFPHKRIHDIIWYNNVYIYIYD